MGVLRLFRHLLSNYKDFYYILSRPYAIDMLFIDLNAIFHPASREIYFPPPSKDLLRRSTTTEQKSPETLEQLAFENITKYIEAIIQINPPKRVLYLAIDGVAGMCKQSQQRKRRYKAAKERTEQLSHADPAYLANHSEPFNMANITAGTPWMSRLCTYLANWIVQRKQTPVNNVNLANVQVIYNDMYVAGEGEHKLIRYLGQILPKKPRTTYSVYSPDADLIMLCLCLPQGRGYILRENIYDDIQGKWIFVDCNKLKQLVCTDLTNYEINATQYTTSSASITLDNQFQQRIVSDYVLFLMLIGNDFLPSLYCLEIGNQGIETLKGCYSQVRAQNTYLLNEVHLIQQSSFVLLFQHLAYHEPDLILMKYRKCFKYPDSLLAAYVAEKTVKRETKHDGCTDVAKVNVESLDFMGLRTEYYTRKFKDEFVWNEQTFHANVQTIVMHFIRGLHFVMTYYVVSIPTFEWCYEHHYAPLMYDIHEVASRLTPAQWNQLQEFEFKPALSLNQALLGIIPPSSRNVCTETVAEILEKKESHELFTEQFEVDLEGKQQEYEAVCLLPNVPYGKLKQFCREKQGPFVEPSVF